jgi:hypothetical protein
MMSIIVMSVLRIRHRTVQQTAKHQRRPIMIIILITNVNNVTYNNDKAWPGPCGAGRYTVSHSPYIWHVDCCCLVLCLIKNGIYTHVCWGTFII